MSRIRSKIGQMRDQVEIQSPSQGRDSHGGPAPVWTTVATVPASIDPVSGREVWSASRIQPDVTHLISLRYYPGLTPKWRLKQDGRIFNLVAVLDPENRHRYHECQAIEKVT